MIRRAVISAVGLTAGVLLAGLLAVPVVFWAGCSEGCKSYYGPSPLVGEYVVTDGSASGLIGATVTLTERSNTQVELTIQTTDAAPKLYVYWWENY